MEIRDSHVCWKGEHLALSPPDPGILDFIHGASGAEP